MAVILNRKSAPGRLSDQARQHARWSAMVDARIERARQLNPTPAQPATEYTAPAQPVINERQYMNSAEELARAIDVAQVRRAYINEHLKELPSVFVDRLPMTADHSELALAAAKIRKDYTDKFLPLARRQQEEDAIAADTARREKIHADLIASGMPPGQAEYQSQIKMPGEIGFKALGHDLQPVQPALTQQDNQVQPHEAESMAAPKETSGASAGEREFAASLQVPALV